MPDHIFGILIDAPSEGGKTNTLLNIIYRLLLCDKINFYAKNLHWDKYQYLLHDFAKRVQLKSWLWSANDCDIWIMQMVTFLLKAETSQSWAIRKLRPMQ